MGKQFPELSNGLIKFIEKQKLFFVGTAPTEGRINISPKGMDSFRVFDKNRVLWLNMTGSGNETSTHVQENPRMTIMFTAFEGNPMILRLYGQAKVIHRNDAEWTNLISLFPSSLGARQIFDCSIDLVQSSCGYSVPLYDYVEDRTLLKDWTAKKGEEGIKEYWEERNQVSLDGKPTNIVKGNLEA